MEIGENIKRIRKIKGMMQKELAEATGLSVTAIQNIEHGSSIPRKENLQRIANALNVDVWVFIPMPSDRMKYTLTLVPTDDLLEELKRRIES